MLSLLKSEIRKLLTIRSTYVITGLAVLLAAGVNFYLAAFKVTEPIGKDAVASGVITGTLSFVAIFAAVVAMLMVTHEYRYNTIYYSLTSARSRTQVLFAKFLVFTLYCLKFTALIALVSFIAMLIGLKVSGHDLPAQQIDWWHLIWTNVYYVWGNAAFAAVIGFLVRNQVGAIVAYFVGTSAVEGLLSLVLKENSIYMPFMALGRVGGQYSPLLESASVGKAALVSGAWLAVSWLIAWILFVRRDAN